jgi:hypothetical protein
MPACSTEVHGFVTVIPNKLAPEGVIWRFPYDDAVVVPATVTLFHKPTAG